MIFWLTLSNCIPEIIQLIIICEMCVLSMWAVKMYSRPVIYDDTGAVEVDPRELALLDKTEYALQRDGETY